MERRLAAITLGALILTACAGDNGARPTSAPTTTTETTTTEATTTAPPPTSTTTTVAPTITLDEDATLREVEEAYLDAFWVGKEALRRPTDLGNEARIRAHFTGRNLELALENLERVVAGGLVARENSANKTFAAIVEPAEFIEGSTTLARLTVCEFNSDRIYELGTAPDGSDALLRDEPISILIVVRMAHVDGQWKSQSGTTAEEIRSEDERCSSVQ